MWSKPIRALLLDISYILHKLFDDKVAGVTGAKNILMVKFC